MVQGPLSTRLPGPLYKQLGIEVTEEWFVVGGYYYPTPVTQTLDPDGLPDWWKVKNGFSPSNNTVGLQFAPDGYTYLEKYLHELNAPFLPRTGQTPMTISTAFGAGADAQLNENGGVASGDGLGSQLNARWTGVR